MNDPNAIDIIVPVPNNETNHILPCLTDIIANTQRQFRLVVTVFGLMKESAIASLNMMMRQLKDSHWELFNTKTEGFNGVIHNCLKKSESEYQVIVPYDVRIQDKSWFGKMQQPMLAVASASFCAGTQPSSTLAPVRMFKKYSDGPSVFMTNRTTLKTVIDGVVYEKHATDYDRCYFNALMRSGIYAFYIPSMGTYRVTIGRQGRPNQSRRS